MAHRRVPERCPECSSRIRTTDTERRCEECGLICGTDAIDPGPEWRSFDDDTASKRRTGAPLTRSRHDRGLSTEIGYGTTSRITGRKRRQVTRMRREHNRARVGTKVEQNQRYGFTEIWRVQSELSLPIDIRDQACVLFESAQNENLLQGRSIEGFAAAAVYATCRTRSLTRTIDEIVQVARADANELKAAYDALNRELGLETGPIDPTQFLPRFASSLEIGTELERRAHDYVQTLLEGNHIGGRHPGGVAAGCLYHVSQRHESDPITQRHAADVADVAPATIRSTVKLIRDLE